MEAILYLTGQLMQQGVRWNLDLQTLPIIEHKDPLVNIQNMIELFRKCKYKPHVEIVEGKSAAQSKKFRNQGNKMYTKSNLKEANELYTKSVKFAPNESIELSMAYANKSAVLFRLEKYQECVNAIDLCLRLETYPDNLKFKILLRKTECLVILKDAKAKEFYDETLVWIENYFDDYKKDDIKMKLKECYDSKIIKKSEIADPKPDEVFNEYDFANCNKEIPSVSDALALEYNKTFGRHFLATRDITPGEIVIKEIAYCKILNIEKRNLHCWGCLEPIWNCIPCNCCVNVVFCSEKCKEGAWKKFHDIECEILPHMFALLNDKAIGNNIVGSLRMTILAVKEFGSIQGLQDELKKVDEWEDPRTKGFSKDQKIHSNTYRSIYSLNDNMDPDYWQLKLVNVVVTLFNLATKTQLFGTKIKEDWDEISHNEDVMLIARLILKNQNLKDQNTFLTSCQDNDSVFDSNIYPSISLVNHSCSPNVCKVYRKDCTILFAIHPIKKGEQIYISYTFDFSKKPQVWRNQTLSKRYFVQCKCIACKKNWPLYENCPSYETLLTNHRQKLILRNEMLTIRPFQFKVSYIHTKEDAQEALSYLCRTLEKFHKFVSLPCQELILLRDLIIFVVSLWNFR